MYFLERIKLFEVHVRKLQHLALLFLLSVSGSVDKNPLNSVVKNPLLMQATQVQFLSQEDPLQEEMATRCSILAWKIPVHGVPKSRT